MTDDAEVDAVVAELQAAGLVTIGTDADGHETCTLTEVGAQLARQLSMSSEDDVVVLLNALLPAGPSDSRPAERGAEDGG